MEQILFINACVREESRTRELAGHLLGQLKGAIIEVNLDQERLIPMDRAMLMMRDEAVKSRNFGHPMLRYAEQFAEADTIVIAAPYCDLSFPALLKAYLEQITVSGVTFRYTEQGVPESLCQAKRLFFVTTAGGSIQWDFGFSYVEALARGFFGVPEIVCFKAERLDIIGADVDGILAQAKSSVDRWISEKST